MLHVHIAMHTRGCQNGGTFMLPDNCTCAPGWNGMNREGGKNINFASSKVMFGVLDIDEYIGDHLWEHKLSVNGFYTHSSDLGNESQSDGRTFGGFTDKLW